MQVSLHIVIKDMTTIVPSISRVPTIYNMSPTDYTDIVHKGQSGGYLPF
jgi:hypothetical protein